MTEGEKTRLIAWSNEMRGVHERRREALRLSMEALASGDELPNPGRELLLFCHGFCTALEGHHRGEDALLFPAVEAAHPEMAAQLRKLEQDHAMIGYLVSGLQSAVDRRAAPESLGRNLEGLSAIMESHFRFEERALLGVLESLDLDAPTTQVFGPL